MSVSASSLSGGGGAGWGGEGGRGQLSCASRCCLICGDQTSCCVWCSLRGGSEQKGFSAELDLFKPVVPSASRHSKSHRELLVLLRKREPGPYWSQLVRGSSNVSACVCVCVCVCVRVCV